MSADGPAIRGRWLPMSFEDFLEWSGDAYGEWVDGRGIAFPSRSTRHQEIVGWLLVLVGLRADLGGHGAAYPLRIAMRLAAGRSLRMPDLLFVAHEHRERIGTDWLEGPADLVMEVVSDDSVESDRVEKFAEYAAAGIPEYWLFDSRPCPSPVEVFHLSPDGRYRATVADPNGCYYSRVLPLFWLDPAWLQQEPLPSPLETIQRIAPEALRAKLDALQ